jgi:hypothetical protein
VSFSTSPTPGLGPVIQACLANDFVVDKYLYYSYTASLHAKISQLEQGMKNKQYARDSHNDRSSQHTISQKSKSTTMSLPFYQMTAGDNEPVKTNVKQHRRAPADIEDLLGRSASDSRPSPVSSILLPPIESQGSSLGGNQLENEDTKIDAMGVSTDYIQPECHENSASYFGPASTASFLDLVR